MTEITVTIETDSTAFNPMIAANGDGRMVVVWKEYSADEIQSYTVIPSYIVMQRYTADGQKAGGEVVVTEASSTSWVTLEDVSILENGEVVVISKLSSDVIGDYQIVGNKFTENGARSNSFVDVRNPGDDGVMGEIGDVSVTPLENGDFVAVWTDGQSNASGSDIHAQRYDSNLEKVGEEFIVNTVTNGTQSDAKIVTLEDGRYMVVWTDHSGQGEDDSETSIKAQIFTNDGTQIGTEFLVNSSTEGIQTNPAIAQLASGGFVVTWMDGDAFSEPTTLRARIFDADGNPIGDDFEISPGWASGFEAYSQSNPSVLALGDGGFILAWDEVMISTPEDVRSWISVQKFDSTGETVGDVMTLGGTLSDSSLVDLGNGSFAVASSVSASFTQDGFLGIEIHLFNVDEHLPIKAIGDDTDDVFIGTMSDNDTLLGYGGDDTLNGEAGNDRIAAGDGDDVVDGGEGNDLIGGGKGDDSIDGGAGDDTIGAGRDSDTVDAGDGDDIVVAYFGDDVVHGGRGNDRLIGHVGNDHIIGGADQDTIGGGYGADTIYGGTGEDKIGSGAQDDLVYGGSGNDLISGTNGHDTLIGGVGDDTLAGGDHNDLLTGGDGADVFKFRVFNSGTQDVITDFTTGEDILEMRGNFTGLNISSHAEGIQIEKNGHVIVLENVETLTEDDFNFV